MAYSAVARIRKRYHSSFEMQVLQKENRRVMTIAEAKNLDMVDYLSRLGIEPAQSPRGSNYWYISPLHDEKTASFKINRLLNCWYDFSLGVGGTLIDFGIAYHKCSISEFLKLVDGSNHSLTATSKTNLRQSSETGNGGIEILSMRAIGSVPLLRYLHQRRIPLDVARQYLSEINYFVGQKTYYALGFKNDQGGYELRNAYVKNSSSPKGPTFIDNSSKNLAVFEGFFDFLSFLSIRQNQAKEKSNFLILNSTSFFDKSLPIMQEHKKVSLFLDNDSTGSKFTERALNIDRAKFSDERNLYAGYKDLNDWIVNIGKQTLRQRP